MKTRLRIKIALSILTAAVLTITTVGDAYATIVIHCNEKGDGIIVTIQGFRPNQIVPVMANGAAAGQITTDAQGNGVATIPAQAGVTYDVSIGNHYFVKTVKCEPKGPSGNQGQTAPGSSTTAVNGSPTYGVVGDPVSTSSGEYFFALPLIHLGGFIPAQFVLRYASQMDKSAAEANDPFGGDHFTHNFHAAIKIAGSDSLTVFWGGELIAFKKAEGEWKIEKEEAAYQLQEAGAYFFLLDPILQRISTFTRTGNNAWLTRVEDRNGNALTITNDGAGRVRRVDDGLGRFLIFTYANPGGNWTWPHLAQVTDQANRAIEFGYTSTLDGALTTHLTSVTDTMGGVTKFTYAGETTHSVISAVTRPLGNTPYTQKYELLSNGVWRVIEQEDALGNVTKLSFGDTNTTLTDPLGVTTTHSHKDTRLLDTMTDAAGKAATLGYDDAGRRNSITDRLGDTTSFTYHPETGQLASVTNAKGDTLAFTYAPQEQTFSPADGAALTFTFYNLARVDYPDGTREEFTFDERGNVVTHTDTAGAAWAYTYDERGQLLTAANPAGGAATFTYNADGTLAASENAETGLTQYGYDEYKRLNGITYADGSAFQIAYDLNDRLTSVTDENGAIYAYEYDANGNLITATDPSGAAAHYAYDLMDRLTQITDRLGKSAATTYDPLGRLASLTDPTGVETTFGYDPHGWLNAVSMGGQTWQTAYDAEGVPVSNASPMGSTTTYQTDELGLLSAAADPLGNTVSLTRDSLNRITGVADPLGRETAYTYDARGLLASVTPPLVGAATYTRNDLGLLTNIADLNGQNWSFDYTPLGRLTSATDPLGNVQQHTYDDRGRLAQTAFADGGVLTYTYDAAGNLTGLQDASGLNLQYTYDSLNRLIAANGLQLTRDAEGRVTSTQCKGDACIAPSGAGGGGFGATYDAAGRVQTLDYGTFTVTYTYDEATGLLASVSDSLTDAKIEFTYDADRRLTGLNRSNGVNTALTWDAASRLTGLKDLSGVDTILDLQYTLDAAGQVTSAQVITPLDPASALAGDDLSRHYEHDAASQISTDGYAYDARGRLTASPDHTFQWDAVSNLAAIDQATFTYNGLGDLQTRRLPDGATNYHYNYALGLAPIVAEQDAATGDFLRYYVWSPDGALLYAIDGGGTAGGSGTGGSETRPYAAYFYHFDRTGSTLALTDADGAVSDAYAYTPYGQMLGHEGASTQPFTFAGHWGVRQEGDLYHMRARWYDPATARFISREPFWPQTFDPMTLNPYQYGSGNPITNIDPYGLYAEPHSAYEQRMWAEWIAEISAQCPDCTETEILDAASGRLLALRARLKADALKQAQAAKRGLGVAGWLAQIQAAALQQAQAQAMLGGLGLGRLIAQNQEALQEAQAQALIRRLGGLGLGRLIAQNQEALRQAQAQALIRRPGGLGLGRLIAQNQEALRQAQAQALIRGLGLGHGMSQVQAALKQAQKQRIADWWARFAAATREQAAIQRAVRFMVNVGLRQTPNDKWPAGAEWER